LFYTALCTDAPHPPASVSWLSRRYCTASCNHQ